MRIFNGVAFVAALTMGASVQAADVNVTYAAYGPPTSSNVEFGIIPFLETAKAMGDGTIDYTLHSGGSLLGAKAMLGGMKDGMVDGGQVLAVYFPAELPLSNLAMALAPMLRSGGPALAAAITDYVLTECPGCKAEMEANNIMFLGAYSTTSYSLLCTKPIDTLESLAGLKVRVPGDFAYLASFLGMTPVNMGIGETYESLQRGALDCTLGPVGWLQQFSLGEVAKNVLNTSYGVSYGGPIISLTKTMWDGLDDTQKTAFQTGAAIGIFRAANDYIASDEEVLAGAEQSGYSITEPGEALLAKLQEFNPYFNDLLISRAKENGIEDAEGIVNGFRKTLDMWTSAMEEIGDDEEAFVKKMMEEVYSDM
ncbi:C4-dicarboxylate TRAP transporter substrate-binding protein [Chachezhania sediminis]|uniref:C4-dicarboxylate TRAP transporter substrate-binding protein n=1 Tax=Chachezhania sediminis TaxID=2599291 RepID=UPI00131A76FA|nr:C4-dicarboxylate TRAP transporter substrate-binding protein [Chachezhania sediminis]